MKKTLLVLAVSIITALGLNAQSVWNFSEAPFGATPTVSFNATFTYNGLTVGTDGSAPFTMDGNNKTIDGTSYTSRLKTGGGGSPVSPSLIPVTRFLSINVSGASTINLGMMSSSSSATRTLIIVNEGETVLDSIVNISGAAAATYTYNYTGAATKLYFYSRSSGINYYYISATNVITAVKNILADKGISYNSNLISNNNNLSIEVYNVLGKLVAKSNSSIDTNDFAKGVYVVRAKGLQGAFKFNK